MAVDGILLSLPGSVAGADLSAHQFMFVAMSINVAAEPGTVVPVDHADAAALPVGVCYGNTPNIGESVQVVISGMAKVRAAAAIAAGDEVNTDGTGMAITGAGMGMAIKAANGNPNAIPPVVFAAGELVEVLLNR